MRTATFGCFRQLRALLLGVPFLAQGLPSWADELPVVAAAFGQERALHRQRQQGLPSPAIRRVFASGETVVVETDRGFARWTGQAWTACAPREVAEPPDVPPDLSPMQAAISRDASRWALATSQGLYEKRAGQPWQRLRVADGLGRIWADSDVRGVAYDAEGQLWFATLAGVGRRSVEGEWRFFTGTEGLPYNDFTCAAAAPDGSVWFGTRRGAIRFHAGDWDYRQGPRWLPDDQVVGIHVDAANTAWLATPAGMGCIARRPMTLAEKAAYFEQQIDSHLKRTPYGYVASARVAALGDTSQVTLHDSDNDGLWTAMYGASQCFAYAATGSPRARQRANQVMRALRFLQVVTQGGEHSPPRGYVARTILPTSAPDPNMGRLLSDRRFQLQEDRLWKVYQPRWPTSADGKWYWKSDTSSDELDGHYFFYALYHDLVAESRAENESVRQVVADLTDHLLAHDFVLQDHDGLPTRWANFRPAALNYDVDWYLERGLNSMSMLSYLAVAHHVTGEQRYQEASLRLRQHHSYAINAMVPKLQRGVGSGNQSDDEMAFMSFYNLIRYTKDESLRRQYLAAFYDYWTLEQPERNPFFHFAYAAVGLGETLGKAPREQSASPWEGWLEDSLDTLQGFPLDRYNWAHTNSHRLDVVALPRQQARHRRDVNRRAGRPIRGHRVDGKVLPVEERFFSHWNTDPWRLDYGGDGRTLACGSVFLLPYYMGRHHGFIAEASPQLAEE